MPLTPHTTILDGKYTIIRELGKGAFAYVWLAEDHRVGQQVAIKEMRRGELSRDEFTDLASRFQREAKIGRALRHPNVVEVYTVEQWKDDLLLVMEFVEGETLQERLVREGPLLLETALDVAMQLCDALDGVHAHPLGIVHRDIKPSNILLSQRGEARLLAKLTDFGLAQLAAESGRSVGRGAHHPGTPLYMAPEQESGFGYLAPAADIYALALTLGEMLAGRPVKPRLLRGDTWAEILREEPEWLAEVLGKATAREWQERYRQAGEVKAALQTGLRSEVEAREQARREAEERARQEKLASLYNAAQAALQARHWQEAIEHYKAIAAIDPGYRDVVHLKAEAEARLLRERSAEEQRKKEEAKLQQFYGAAQAALEAENWNEVLRRCQDIQQLRPGYRDVDQIKARAQVRLAEQRAAQERDRREQEKTVQSPPSQPPIRTSQPRSFPWLPTLASVAAVVVIVSIVWGIRGCGRIPVVTPLPEPTLIAGGEATQPPPEPTMVPEPTPVPDLKGLTGTVTLWHAWKENEIESLNDVIAAFQAENPDVQFDVLYVPFDDLRGKYERAAATGGGPSVLIGAADWGPALFDAELIADVRGFTSAPFLVSINEAALGAVEYKGALIGLPLSGYVQTENIYLSANADRNDRDVAWAFMEFFLSPEAQALLADPTKAGPIPAMVGVEVTDPLIAQAAGAFAGGAAFPVIPEMYAYWGPMDTTLKSVFHEGADPAVALLQAFDSITAAIVEIRGQ